MDLTMLRRLANGEEPYGGGPFDADHIKIFRDGARELVAELEQLRARVAELERGTVRIEWGVHWEGDERAEKCGDGARGRECAETDLAAALADDSTDRGQLVWREVRTGSWTAHKDGDE